MAAWQENIIFASVLPVAACSANTGATRSGKKILIERKMTTANDITETMLGMRNEAQSRILMRFFKTGKGEYGEGDKFLGIRVPAVRAVAREAYGTVALGEVEKLLRSPWHEIRLCGFLLLVEEMRRALPTHRNVNGNAARRTEIARFYIAHAPCADNWDLVDLSCGGILGKWLLFPDENGGMPSREILDSLAESSNLWEQRIAIVSTSALIRVGQYDDTLRMASKLLNHPHDLIHKAVGWMLREVGKKEINVLRTYLEAHCHEMARTTLRYAIERMDAGERREWLKR